MWCVLLPHQVIKSLFIFLFVGIIIIYLAFSFLKRVPEFQALLIWAGGGVGVMQSVIISCKFCTV